jgi:hypothetical protein
MNTGRANHPTLPPSTDLERALGATLTASDPADGYWKYELRDEGGISVQLSVNSIERSVQTVVSIGAHEVQRTSHEGLERLWIEHAEGGAVLRGSCRSADTDTVMSVGRLPVLRVYWATLVRV